MVRPIVLVLIAWGLWMQVEAHRPVAEQGSWRLVSVFPERPGVSGQESCRTTLDVLRQQHPRQGFRCLPQPQKPWDSQ
jgi:hypothetical protein